MNRGESGYAPLAYLVVNHELPFLMIAGLTPSRFLPLHTRRECLHGLMLVALIDRKEIL